MAQITKDKIIFDSSDWLAGLHPRYNSGPTDTPLPKSENKLSYALKFHPYRNFGMASPGFFPTSATNASVVTGSAIRSLIMAAETTTYYAYGMNSGDLLFQVLGVTTSGTGTAGSLTSSPGTWPHQVVPPANASEGQDVCFYPSMVSGTRSPTLFYSWNNSSSSTWSVGRYQLDGTNFNDNFMAANGAAHGPATPLSATSRLNQHPMIVGDDDQLYIGDGNLLHAYDGANTATNTSAEQQGKFFSSVLTLPANFRITSFAKFQRNLVIFGYKELSNSQGANPAGFSTTEAIAYFWDYIALDPYDSKTLNDNYVSCGFEFAGTVGCFTYGRKQVLLNPQLSKVMLFDGSRFKTVATFDSNPPFHNAVEILGDTISWNSDGNVYLYGPPYPGAPNGLNRVTAGNGSTNGAIRTLSTSVKVISSGTSTSGGLDTINSGFSSGLVTTAPAMPVFPDYQIGKVKAVKVYFGKTSSADATLSVFLISDFGAQTQIMNSSAAITASNQVQRITTALNGSAGSLPRFTSLGVILQWTAGVGTAAQIVDRIEVEYEPVTFNNS